MLPRSDGSTDTRKTRLNSRLLWAQYDGSVLQSDRGRSCHHCPKSPVLRWCCQSIYKTNNRQYMYFIIATHSQDANSCLPCCGFHPELRLQDIYMQTAVFGLVAVMVPKIEINTCPLVLIYIYNIWISNSHYFDTDSVCVHTSKYGNSSPWVLPLRGDWQANNEPVRLPPWSSIITRTVLVLGSLLF